MPIFMIAEGLVRAPHGVPHLIGGRRVSDGKIVFPMPTGHDASYFEPIDLPDQGTLWSFTVQRFRPKSPYIGPGDDHSFTPYAVGYIELPNATIVESRLLVDDFSQLEIGMRMTLDIELFSHDDQGQPIHTYAFRPCVQEDAQ